jgi:hypothetical protein
MSLFLLGAALTLLSFLLGAVLRPFLTEYSKKKGENLATHEDIDKLVNQVRLVTKTTEDIKAEISSGLWDRQRRWDMKREVLFEAARRLADIDDALLSYSIALKEDHKKQQEWNSRTPSPEETLSWLQLKHDRLTRWSQSSTGFDETRAFVAIVCTAEAKKAFDELGILTNKIAVELGKSTDSYDQYRAELAVKILAAKSAIRKELEVDNKT